MQGSDCANNICAQHHKQHHKQHHIQQNIVIVTLPALTRKGSTDVPLMCNDIPLPDEETVQALLDDPETAVPNFVIQRYFTAKEPSITQPDPSNTRVKVVHRDRSGNHRCTSC